MKCTRGENLAFMQMAELFEKAISNSEYVGDFEYGKLFTHISEHKYNAFATMENDGKSKTA